MLHGQESRHTNPVRDMVQPDTDKDYKAYENQKQRHVCKDTKNRLRCTDMENLLAQVRNLTFLSPEPQDCGMFCPQFQDVPACALSAILAGRRLRDL